MSNFLKNDAKKVFSELRRLSGKKLPHFNYMGCDVSSKFKGHCSWTTTYKFRWWRINDKVDICFEFTIFHHSEELIKALELCYNDETSYQYKEEHKTVSRFFPTGNIGSVSIATDIDCEIERLASRIIDYSCGLSKKI